jgi:hypothetical protein
MHMKVLSLLPWTAATATDWANGKATVLEAGPAPIRAGRG